MNRYLTAAAFGVLLVALAILGGCQRPTPPTPPQPQIEVPVNVPKVVEPEAPKTKIIAEPKAKQKGIPTPRLDALEKRVRAIEFKIKEAEAKYLR